jgi:hypothetical protein
MLTSSNRGAASVTSAGLVSLSLRAVRSAARSLRIGPHRKRKDAELRRAHCRGAVSVRLSGPPCSLILRPSQTLAPRVVTRLRALVLLPTRDLVAQVRETFEAFGKGTGLKVRWLSSSDTRKLTPFILRSGRRRASTHSLTNRCPLSETMFLSKSIHLLATQTLLIDVVMQASGGWLESDRHPHCNPGPSDGPHPLDTWLLPTTSPLSCRSHRCSLHALFADSPPTGRRRGRSPPDPIVPRLASEHSRGAQASFPFLNGDAQRKERRYVRCVGAGMVGRQDWEGRIGFGRPRVAFGALICSDRRHVYFGANDGSFIVSKTVVLGDALA